MKKRKVILIMSITIIFCVVFLTVGFSAFSNNLSINGLSANVKTKIDIRIKSNDIKFVSEGANISYNEHTIDRTSYSINLPYSDSYAIFDVGILNLGNAEMGIKSISGINEGLKYEIVSDEYTSEGYNSYHEKELLCDDNDASKCKLGAESHILIKISYESLEAYNNATNKNFNINLLYEFKRIYKVEYSAKILKLLKSTPVNYVMENDDLDIEIKYNDVDYIVINSTYTLVQNIDYFLENQILSIKDIKANIYVGINYDSYGNMTIYSKWLSKNSVEITLNGTASTAFYIRLRNGDLYIATDKSDLKNDDYIREPLFTGKDTIYQEFEYLDGTCNLKAAITIKFRDAKASCDAVDIAQFITHNTSKNNFNEYDTYAKSGPVSTNGKALSQLSFYTAKDNSFDNYKFRITYGKTN